MTTLFIPSPSSGVWYLGPLPLRGYALCIIAGIIAAIWIGERRWVGRGGLRGEVTDLALWAVPFGVIGGRIYHVITDHDLYFGDDKSPIQALYVWRGGLGIWGAIAFGAVGVYLGAKSKGIRVPPVLDAMAPGVLVAQAIGRWGNWFNQELFGKPSTQPWALKIDPENRPPGYEQYSTFQPTFLYECIWDLGAFAFVIWADRRFKLGHGRVLALYVMAYTAGRGWIEMLRIDDVEYQHVLGLRLNVWTSIVLFCLATAYFVVVGRKHPGRETVVYTEKRLAKDRAAAEAAEGGEGGETSESAKGVKGEKGAETAKGKKGATVEGAAAGAAAATLVDEKTATKSAEKQPAAKPSAKKSAATAGAKQAADQTAAEETPAEETPAQQAPAEQATAGETPATEAPTDSAPAETTAAPKTPTTKATAAKTTAAKKSPAKKAAPAKKAPAAKKAPTKAAAKKTTDKKSPVKKATPEAASPESATPEEPPTEAAPTEKPRNNRTDTPE